MDTDKALELIKEIRSYDQKIPVSLLIYYNLIFQRGIEKFYQNAREAGVDAILAADCPIEESSPLLEAAKKHNICQVFIVAPTTPIKRLKEILKNASGYLYLVGLLGVTGVRASLQKRTLELIKRVRPLTKLSLCVGFGISKPEQVKEVIAAGADGCIVGSAIVNLIKENLKDEEKMLRKIREFVSEMKKATH